MLIALKLHYGDDLDNDITSVTLIPAITDYWRTATALNKNEYEVLFVGSLDGIIGAVDTPGVRQRGRRACQLCHSRCQSHEGRRQGQLLKCSTASGTTASSLLGSPLLLVWCLRYCRLVPPKSTTNRLDCRLIISTPRISHPYHDEWDGFQDFACSRDVCLPEQSGVFSRLRYRSSTFIAENKSTLLKTSTKGWVLERYVQQKGRLKPRRWA